MSEFVEQELAGLFSLSLPGEWGSDPQPDCNALGLRAADFTKDCKLKPTSGAPRLLPKEKLASRTLREGDLLIEKSGGSIDQPVGRVVYFNREDENQTYAYSNFLQLLRIADGFDKKFVFYLMAYLYGSGLVYRYQQQTTGIFNLKLENYLSETVSLPDCDNVRKKIRQILELIDDAIEQTEALIEKYSLVKAGMMHDLFTRGLTPDGKLRPPREEAPDLYKETPIGWMPKEWQPTRLDELSDIVRGSTPRPAKDPRYFDGRDVPWITVGELSKEDWPYLNDTRTMLTELGSKFSRHLKSGTLVISNSGYGCGVPKILNIDGCANDGVAAFLNFSKDCDQRFIYYFLYSQIETLRTKVARGNDQPNLNTDMLGAFCAPVPDHAEQAMIAERLWVAESLIKKEKINRDKLRIQKSGLMHDLLTGEVPVTIDAPEAAHV